MAKVFSLNVHVRHRQDRGCDRLLIENFSVSMDEGWGFCVPFYPVQ